MRAVQSTLNAAGNFKKSEKTDNEEIQVLKAILQVNEAKFLSKDLPLFHQITEDLFPGIVLEKSENTQFIA